MTNRSLDAVIEKLRALPPEKQNYAASIINDLSDDSEPLRLSDDELTLLKPAVVRSERGEFASQDKVDAVLYRPWK